MAGRSWTRKRAAMWQRQGIMLLRPDEDPRSAAIGYRDGAAVPLLRRFRGTLEAAARPADARTRSPSVAGDRRSGGYRLRAGVAAGARPFGFAPEPQADRLSARRG